MPQASSALGLKNAPKTTPTKPSRICVLGATGSIGTQTLSLLEDRRDAYQVVGLSARQNLSNLSKLAKAFPEAQTALVSVDQSPSLDSSSLKPSLLGDQSSLELIESCQADTVVCAMMGAEGLLPFRAALLQGAKVLVANKEAIILGGHLVGDWLKQGGGQLIPLDSEHNAAFQLLEAIMEPRDYPLLPSHHHYTKLILPASGGPFWGKSVESLRDVTPQAACKHPNWAMGAKISIDSATLMNKALELIEAHYLFGIPANKLDVVVQPQSFVHAIWVTQGGQALASMSPPDMKGHIAYALDHPHAKPWSDDPFALPSQLSFQPLEDPWSRGINLAKAAIKQGQSAPLSLNALNEVAVSAFLEGQIGFLQILDYIEKGMNALSFEAPETLEHALSLDSKARSWLKQHLLNLA